MNSPRTSQRGGGERGPGGRGFCELDLGTFRNAVVLPVGSHMNSIAYVALGLIALMLANLLNRDGDSFVTVVSLIFFGLTAIVKGFTHPSGKTTVSGEPTHAVAKRQARIEDALAHMPFAEEVDDTAATQSRSPTIPAKFGKPAPKVAATPYRSPTAASGQVTLNSAKYLNGGKPDFRKGTTRDTSD